MADDPMVVPVSATATVLVKPVPGGLDELRARANAAGLKVEYVAPSAAGPGYVSVQVGDQRHSAAVTGEPGYTREDAELAVLARIRTL